MKRIALTILIVVLFVATLAGTAYAVGDHQPIRGDKLVGIGEMGTRLFGAQNQSRDEQSTEFRFTNPDCVSEITIERVSIIDETGTIVYEGPFIKVEDGVRTIQNEISPHEVCLIKLSEYMYEGGDLTEPDSWKTPADAMSQDLTTYTVEINWGAKSLTCQLTGWQKTYRVAYELGERYRAISESPMVNLNQKRVR